jgi:hypothetical protein
MPKYFKNKIFIVSIFVLGSSKIKIIDVALSPVIRLRGRVLDKGDYALVWFDL